MLRSRPYYYLIDICNLCNLRCPLCPTGNETIGRRQGIMSLEEYQRIFDQVKDHAIVVSLYNHGEPFLNDDVFAIIEHTRRHNVGTNMSSNFNWPKPVDTDDIVRSGLEYITCSIDGVAQDSYETYRVRGNIDEAFDNLRRLLASKKALGSKTPFVEWQFIVFKHVEHEMARAREMAIELGVDFLRFVAPAIQPEAHADHPLRDRYMPANPVFRERDPALGQARGYVYDQPCFYLYRSMSIYPGGGVSPCCFGHEKRHDFGNLLTHSVSELWNNESYRSARMLFGRKPDLGNRTEVICDACPLFHKRGAAGPTG